MFQARPPEESDDELDPLEHEELEDELEELDEDEVEPEDDELDDELEDDEELELDEELDEDDEEDELLPDEDQEGIGSGPAGLFEPHPAITTPPESRSRNSRRFIHHPVASDAVAREASASRRTAPPRKYSSIR